MRNDVISLLISVTVAIIGAVSTIYKNPTVGIIVFGIGVIGYLGYVFYASYYNLPGSNFFRFLPILVLTVVGGGIYWVWPSYLQIVLFEDQNNNGKYETIEPGIKNEQIYLTDADNIMKTLKTQANGYTEIQKMPLGSFSLKIRNIVIQGMVKRGSNMLKVGYVPKIDTTKPKTVIFLGDENGFSTDITFRREVDAHLWFHDPESGIAYIEIDWGDGHGWKRYERNDPKLQFYIFKHVYQKVGKKKVKFKAVNRENISSYPTSNEEEPPKPRYHFHIIDIKPLPKAP